jgi:hypothetical protein
MPAPVRTTEQIQRDNARTVPRENNQSPNYRRINVFLDSIQPIYRKPTKEELQAVAPNQEDIAKYAEFLKKSKTGIAKLMTDINCADNTSVVSATPECLIYSMPGAGSSFSFRTNSYRIKRLADLSLVSDSFQVPGTLTTGLMINLGDIPIEQVSLTAKSLEFLNEFVPPSEYKKALETAQSLKVGIKQNGFIYRNALSVQENNTYFLRSIAYRGTSPRTVQNVTYNEFDYDKREDVFVAFRVIRKDNDGNVTIIWKELKKQKSPKLKK